MKFFDFTLSEQFGAKAQLFSVFFGTTEVFAEKRLFRKQVTLGLNPDSI